MNSLPSQIKRNTLLIISFLLIVSWGVGYLFLGYQLEKSIDEQFQRVSDSTHKLFSLNMEAERDHLEIELEKIVSEDGLAKSIADKNYNKIDSIVKPYYKHFQLMKRSVDILTFRSDDGVTLYRAHKPEYFGDTLNKNRKLIVDTNTMQRSFSGFEVGKLKTTFRITKPIFYKNKYVGSVEIGISPTKFIKELNAIFKIDMGIAVDKAFLNVMLDKPTVPLDETYALVEGGNCLKNHFFYKNTKESKLHKIDFIIPLKNHLKETFGYFVVAYDISDIVKKDREFTYSLFFIMAVITIIIGIVLHKSFNKVLGQFTKQVYTDHLTGLQNRQALDNLLSTEKSNLLILSNIKEFSLLNELYGIDAGNKILVEIAKIFTEFSKKYNFNVYRISSDEYVLVKFEDNLGVDKYFQIIKELQENINAFAIKIEGIDDIISVEIYSGVSVNHANSLAEAQMALKKAKEKSLPYLAYSQQVDTKKQSEQVIKIKRTIRHALEHNNVLPFFQPITNRDAKIVKYEALVRIVEFNGAEKTVLTPDKFLDISMQSALYKKIAKEVLEQSLAFFADRDEKISVNFLPNDFFNSSIMNCLMEGIKCFDSPERVVVEITEQEGVDDFDRLLLIVEKLRKVGVQIAIDDFGSGYANYAHVLKIRPDYLKIDGSLIHNIITDEESKILVKSIVNFAKELDIITVAEYVENEEIFELLKEYGVDEFQGYYFGHPTDFITA